MSHLTEVNVSRLIDSIPIIRFQILTITLCGLSTAIDGFDVQVIGYVAPTIIQKWQLDKSSMGVVFAGGLAGLLLGSLLFSLVADRWGRRSVLIGSTLCFAIGLFATAFATSLFELTSLRFITGLGLGSILPNAMALAGEYAPSKRRSTVLVLVSVGFTTGAAVAGFIAAFMIPRWGWHSVFYFGGAISLRC